MKAIDLYSGIGGWHLGFQIAGINIVSSYEWWEAANDTHRKNFSSKVVSLDIRKMDLGILPKKVDIIVGSPPCTQFSFANRGGSGDISDGLLDIYKFLEIVEFLEPRYWAMENVPRVSEILRKELAAGGSLERFKDLFSTIVVVNMTDYGLPQNRKRMLAGRFPSELLEKYQGRFQAPSLGATLDSLKRTKVKDILYGMYIAKKNLTENDCKIFLDSEETRINREAKTYHPVYNKMRFPDATDKPARTITATCTKVSRESIVVDEDGELRLLTLRESASLQGFPVTYQFFGKTYNDKLKMIGNAFPPVMSYYIAHSMLGTRPEEIVPPSHSSYKHPLPNELPIMTPCSNSKSFPASRRFRFAVPNLRFGSGVRFELANGILDDSVIWRISFYFGTSKRIQQVELGEEIIDEVMEMDVRDSFIRHLSDLDQYLQDLTSDVTPSSLQNVWSHRERGIHPFEIIDTLGRFAKDIQSNLPVGLREEISGYIVRKLTNGNPGTTGLINRKIVENWDLIFSGILVGALFNERFYSGNQHEFNEF